MSTIVTQTSYISSNQKIITEVQNKNGTVIPFRMIGNGNYSSPLGLHSMDLLRVTLTLSTPARRVFGMLLDNFDKTTDRIPLSTQQLTQSQKNQIYAGLNELIANNLIIRLNQKEYMFNPTALIHTKDERRKELLDLWISLGGKV